MRRDARKHVVSSVIKIVAADNQSLAFIDQECDCRVLRIDSVYNVGNNGTATQSLQVGTAASAALYLTYAVQASQAAGVKVAHTVASSAILPKGTALVIKKSSASSDAGGNAEVTVNVTIERLDTTNTN